MDKNKNSPNQADNAQSADEYEEEILTLSSALIEKNRKAYEKLAQ